MGIRFEDTTTKEWGMCQCTPEIRTPYCGRGDCVPSPLTKDEIEQQFAARIKDQHDWYNEQLADLRADYLRRLEDAQHWRVEQLVKIDPELKEAIEEGG